MVNPAGNSRMLMSRVSRDYYFIVSTSTALPTHFRPLTMRASFSSSTRLLSHPPDLIRWVRREGGFVHPAIKIASDSLHGGFGLVASEDIPKGSDLIALPTHVPLRFQLDSLNDGTDGVDYVLTQLAEQVPEELWAMKLGLKLLKERATVGSFWWPYICNLPETYSVPIFFPGDDIKNLQYAPLVHQVNKRCRFLLEFEKVVSRVLENVRPEDHPFSGQAVEASSLGWAMSAVSSRAFRLHGDGTLASVPMMLPLIDMCNHSFDPNAQIVQEQDKEKSNHLVKVVARTEIKQDDAVVLNYGCLSNDLLLLDYGFVIPSNPYDCIELKYDGGLLDAASMAAGVTSPNFSSPSPWQQQILSQLGLHGDDAASLKVTLGGREVVDGRLLAALRVGLATDMETIKKLDVTSLKSLYDEMPLGMSNEISVLRTTIALCVIALGHFPTQLKDDEAVLSEGGPTTKLAAQFRVEKKSIIINVMQDLTRRVKKLLLLSKETMQQG